jgi:hypothetical protein
VPDPIGLIMTQTYRRLGSLLDAVAVHYRRGRAGPGWVRPADLADAAVLDELIATRREALAQDYGDRPRATVAAASTLHRYLWLGCLALAGPYLIARRVPRCNHDGMAVSVALDGISVLHPAPAACVAAPSPGGLSVLPEPQLYCLSTDLVAIAAGARPVSSVDELREILRSTVEDQLAPVLSAFGPRVRRGPTGLWATATDQLTAALWHLGKAMDAEHASAAEVHRLLPPTARPYIGGGGFRELHLPDGDRVLTRTRRSCCLHYTMVGQDACLTCPRINDNERIRRLTADPAVNETPEPADQ